MLKLRFTDNPQHAIWLVEPKVTLGSSATCGLVLSETGIDPQHAEIVVDHEDLMLTVFSDTVTVTVNNKQVAPGVTVPLKVGDRLQFGQVELVVVDPKRESSKKTAQTTPGNASGWALKANHAALSNRVYPLNGNVIVGRSSDCDIALAAAHLSRRHAQLSVRDGALFVKDLGSSNGTYLNGKRITEARVKRGDELRFDALSFGVIGPADELDKTTVRPTPASSVSQLQRAGKRVVAPPEANSAATLESENIRVSKSATQKPVILTNAKTQQREPGNTEPLSGASKGTRIFVGIGLLIIIAAGAYFASQNI